MGRTFGANHDPVVADLTGPYGRIHGQLSTVLLHVHPAAFTKAHTMPFQSLKLLFYVTAAAFETLLLHLGVSLISIVFAGTATLSWPILLVICLLAALTTMRFAAIDDSDAGRSRGLSLIIAAVVVAYGAKLQAGGGWSLFAGWSALAPFSDLDSNQPLGGPALLMVCLAVWWRGMMLLDHDHSTLLVVLQRGLLGLVLLVLLLTPVSVINLGAPPWGQLLALEAMLVVGAGLASLTLARIAHEAQGRSARGAWHWLRSSLGTTIALMVVGTLLLSLVSNSATSVVRMVVSALGMLAALIFAPLAFLLTQLWQIIRPKRATLVLPMPSSSSLPELAGQSPTGDTVPQLLYFVAILLTAALYLLPLLALIVLVVLYRRQRPKPIVEDGEVHESLWSWQGVKADLLSLLDGLRPKPQAGLREVLARLRADDPAQRIRRRYVELLLVGEAAQRERLPQQTPLEHEAALAAALPGAKGDVHALTLAYDQARYAPDSIAAADLAAAERAWSTIQAQANKENR